MSILPEVTLSYEHITLPLFIKKISSESTVKRIGNEGMTVDNIMNRDGLSLESKFNNDLKYTYSKELKTAFTRYEMKFNNKQKEIKDIELKIKKAKSNVSREGETSGSNSDGQVRASKSGTQLRIEKANLEIERAAISKEYTDTVEKLHNEYAELLYDFYILPVLSKGIGSKGAGGGKTRKNKNKKTRRMRRKA